MHHTNNGYKRRRVMSSINLIEIFDNNNKFKSSSKSDTLKENGILTSG